MFFIALVSAGDAAARGPAPGLRTVGGITILERQVRQALRAGAAEVLVLVGENDAPATLPGSDPRVRCFGAPADLGARLADRTLPVLLLAPGVIIDDRLVETMARHTEPVLLLVFDREPPAGAERLDSRDHWAGIARLPARTVVRTAAGLGEWELASTLVRVAVEAGVGRLRVSDLDIYAPDRRRSLPFIWARPVDDAGGAAATDLLIASAQKGCLDWPARFLHPPIENALVRLLLPTRVTPNQVTLAAMLPGLGAIAAFAMGQLWTGVILMLLVGPLDGVDGKLARVRAEHSRWGDLEHVADKVIEYGAYLALGWWFATSGHGVGAWLAAGGILLFSLHEAVQGEFFRRFTGRQLDDWGPFERRFRLIAGRRNVYFWSVLPFFALNLWFEGYLMILGYAAVTFSVAEWRFLRAIREYAQRVDPRVGANFTDTAYDFLPRAGAGGR